MTRSQKQQLIGVYLLGVALLIIFLVGHFLIQ